MKESRTNELDGDVAEIIANLASSGIIAVVELITVLVERRAIDPRYARDILLTMAADDDAGDPAENQVIHGSTLSQGAKKALE